MFAVVVIVIAALLVLGFALDVRARRLGRSLRAPGDIKTGIREQRLRRRTRQVAASAPMAEDATDASFASDEELRLTR